MAKETKAKAAAKVKVDVSTPEPKQLASIHGRAVVRIVEDSEYVLVTDTEGTGYKLPRSEYELLLR